MYHRTTQEGERPVQRFRRLIGILIAGAMLLIVPLVIVSAGSGSFPAPTVLVPGDTDLLTRPQPIIVGLAKNDAVIRVYLDGTLNGIVDVRNDISGTANFAYTVSDPLSAGTHNAYAVAVAPDGRTSKRSNTIVFDVLAPMPAPTLFAPVVNATTTAARPYIVGLAKNGSLLRVFIDGVLNGQMTVTNDPSGTASFAYRSLYDLSVGDHTIFVTAESTRGRVSDSSNVVTVTVPDVTFSENGEVLAATDEATDTSGTNTETNENVNTATEEESVDTAGTDEELMSEDTEEGAETDEDSGVNVPLIIGLGLLIVIVIAAIVRVQRDEFPGDGDTPSQPKDPFEPRVGEPKQPQGGTKPDDRHFPPPPPNIR